MIVNSPSGVRKRTGAGDQEFLGGRVHHGLQRSLVDWLERRRAGRGTGSRARCNQESNTDQQTRINAYWKLKPHLANDYFALANILNRARGKVRKPPFLAAPASLAALAK